jgi:hypothetical protein
MEPVRTERVRDRQHVVGQRRRRVRIDWSGARPRRISPLVGSDGVVPGVGKGGELVPPTPRGLGKAVEQHHRLASSWPSFQTVEDQAAEAAIVDSDLERVHDRRQTFF